MYQAKKAGRNAIRSTTRIRNLPSRPVPTWRRSCVWRWRITSSSSITRYRSTAHTVRWVPRCCCVGYIPKRPHLARAVHPAAGGERMIVPVGLWCCNPLRAAAQVAKQRTDTGSDAGGQCECKTVPPAGFRFQGAACVAGSGARPSQLKLELTESMVLENVENTIAKMRELKLLGLSFSMDDFGQAIRRCSTSSVCRWSRLRLTAPL